MGVIISVFLTAAMFCIIAGAIFGSHGRGFGLISSWSSAMAVGPPPSGRVVRGVSLRHLYSTTNAVEAINRNRLSVSPACRLLAAVAIGVRRPTISYGESFL